MAGTWQRRLGLALVAVAGSVALFALLYALSVHAFAPDSDGATVVLEGQAMTHGHPLLSDWAMSFDSFWTVDALWYVVGVLAVGLHPVLLHAVPAAIATAVIAIGVVIAAEERRGAAAIAAAGIVVVILGLPSHALAYFFLRGPLHVGTALWSLVAFLAVRRSRFGLGFAVAVVFLAAGLLGDLQILALGVAPVFAAGITAMLRNRNWRAGLPQVAAALSSLVLAEVVRQIAHLLGTFSIRATNPISTPAQIVRNVKHGLHEGVLMMGVGSSYYGSGGDPRALSYVHVVAILLVFAAVGGTGVALVWGALRGRPLVVGPSSDAAWRLDDMLFFAALASPTAFAVLAADPNPEYGRYLTAGIIFGVVLTGRVVGRVIQDLDWRRAGRVAAVVGLAATSCYAAGVAINLDQPAPVESTAVLGSWLESHHLYSGIGAYWVASIVTVESRGRVDIRPIISFHDEPLVRYDHNSATYWYTERFHFLVFDVKAPWHDVSWRTAVETYGPPSRSYTVDRIYRVMVWKRPLHVRPQIVAR